MSLINPIAPAVEFFLAVYNMLPTAFHAYFNMILGVSAVFAFVSLVWSIR